MASKELSEYSYDELKSHLDKLKVDAIKTAQDALTAGEKSVLDLRKKLEELTGISLTSAKTRGRKKGSKNKASKISEQINRAGKKTGKRKKGGPTAKEAILAVLKKGGTSSKDIVKATGLKPGSVSQALNLLKSTDKTIKHDGKKGGLWSLK